MADARHGRTGRDAFTPLLASLSSPLPLEQPPQTEDAQMCTDVEQAAQGGGGVPIPGGVQKTCRCGILGSGLVDMVVLGGWLDMMTLEVFSNL